MFLNNKTKIRYLFIKFLSINQLIWNKKALFSFELNDKDEIFILFFVVKGCFVGINQM
jgi:hypothetical protein